MTSSKKQPSYRHRKGYAQAIVTLTDRVTKKRRDYWLGTYDSPESRELYHRILAEWEANGRRLPEPERFAGNGQAAATNGEVRSKTVTISTMLAAYWRSARSMGYCQAELSKIKVVARLLRKLYGSTPAGEFGPKRMRLVRDEMVRGDLEADPPRRPWARPYVNAQVRRLRAVFKWAASHEMVPASVHEQLRTMESLKRGRTSAPEPDRIKPVPPEMVEAIGPFTSRQVWALIQLQLFTGARGGELFQLRPKDIERAGVDGVWTYSPAEHKNAHREQTRTIYFGPRAQEVLEPFVEERAPDAYMFSPAEAMAEQYARRHARRQIKLSSGNRPGSNRRASPAKQPGSHYTAASYGRAIQYACDQAFPPPERLARKRVPARGRKHQATRWETDAEWRSRLGPERWEELKTWRREHRWHPHQLRHAAGTQIRRAFGLEAAQLVLGHSSALVTDAVYAERDLARVVEVVRVVG